MGSDSDSGSAFGFTYRANGGKFAGEVVDRCGLALLATHLHEIEPS